jgi:bromodomain-containing protein 8
LLDNVETPKRKKRTASDSNTSVETPVESLVRKLTQERVAELQNIIPQEQVQLAKVKEEIKFLESGSMDETRIREMWAQIEQEKLQKERDLVAHQQWLKEREEKKAEMERIWRPGLYVNVNANKSPSTPPAIKKENELDETPQTPQTPNQQGGPGISTSSATSPLLTSLLKSSSPAPITSQTQSIIQSSNARSAPTITTLLTGGTLSHTAPSNNPSQFLANDHHSVIPASQQAPTLSMLLDKRPLASTASPVVISGEFYSLFLKNF